MSARVATPKNTRAPAGVEDPTRAAPRVATSASGRGDGDPRRPLEGKYVARPDADKHRKVTWVTVATGQTHSYLLATGREPMRSSGDLTNDLRLLLHDEHADARTNAAYATLAMLAIRNADSATRVPRVLADALFDDLGRQAKELADLGSQLTALRAELARAESRSDS